MAHQKVLTSGTRLHEACVRLADVYSGVEATQRYPLYRWTQISNDAAVLAEHVRRRNQEEKALERIAKMLARFLEFIGYFLKPTAPSFIRGKPESLQFIHGNRLLAYTLLRTCLLRESSRSPSNAPKTESLSKWIILKYPHACSKCAGKPCCCVVTPWVFEERRENPGPYLRFPADVEKKQKSLSKDDWRDLTLNGLFTFFNGIYRNTLYQQDPWKVAFHLCEELGEAAIELTRLQSLCVIDNKTLGEELNQIKEKVKRKHDSEVERLRETKGLENADRLKIERKWQTNLAGCFAELERAVSSPEDWLRSEWNLKVVSKNKARDLALRLYFAEIITRKLKEELADVASWLVAVTYAIRPDSKVNGELVSGPTAVIKTLEKEYATEEGKEKILACSWCKQQPCSNGCLIRNSMSDELNQEVIKF